MVRIYPWKNSTAVYVKESLPKEIKRKFERYLAWSAPFLTSSRLVRFFTLTAPAAILGHLGAISLKNLPKHKEVRKLEKELIRPIVVWHMINLWKLAKEVIHYYSATIKPSAAAGLWQSFFFLSNILSFFTTCRDSYWVGSDEFDRFKWEDSFSLV